MQIVFVLFPNLTQLDFTGPLQVLSRLPDAQIHLAAETISPTPTDTVMTINPTIGFDTCPQADILCVPGGFGVTEAMLSDALIEFVKKQAVDARYVTSVCTGAFILGVAGLLKGKKATTHWAYHDYLALFGATPEKSRVVREGNLLTGGGVTAGIDFALTLAAEIAGELHAQSIQLGIEYNPSPPFSAGSPGEAPRKVVSAMKDFYGDRAREFEKVVRQVVDAG